MGLLTRRKFLSGFPLLTLPLLSSAKVGDLVSPRKILVDGTLITSLLPQSGLVFSANLIKYYYAKFHQKSFLNLANGQIQLVGSNAGLKNYCDSSHQESSDSFICLPSSMLMAYSEYKPSHRSYFVLPRSVEEAMWNFVVVSQSRIGSVPFDSAPLDFPKACFEVIESDVQHFRAQLIRNSKLLERSSAEVQLIRAPDPRLGFIAQAEAVLSQAKLPHFKKFLEDEPRLSEKVYREPRYVRNPADYIKNREQVIRWAGNVLTNVGTSEPG
jgi:hypothetical protein